MKSSTSGYRIFCWILSIDTHKGFMNRDQGNILVTWFASDRHAKPPRLGSRMDVQAALIIEPNQLRIETDR